MKHRCVPGLSALFHLPLSATLEGEIIILIFAEEEIKAQGGEKLAQGHIESI